MENNERKSFTFNPQYIDAVEDLENIDKWRAIYCLGYFGVYGDFPEEATAIDKMFVKANLKMLEGSHDWHQKQIEKSKKGGRTPELSDEQIEEAIKQLFLKNGAVPGEKEVKAFYGATSGIRDRDPWKRRDLICLECKKMSETESDKNTTMSYFNF